MKNKTVRIGFLILILGMLVVCGTSIVQAEEKADDGGYKLSAETFENPPNEYRITQYHLTHDRLKKYQKYGIGGTLAFFYSALYPEARNEDFEQGENGVAIIGELVDAALDIDYKVWLADDWGYPSGMAGGRVVAENPDWAVKSLTMLKISGKGESAIDYTLPEDLHDIVHAVLYPVDGWRKVDFKNGQIVAADNKQITATGLKGAWQLRVFARYVRDKDTQAQSTIAQLGHTGRYPDLMNRDAMARFIANMHEPILAQIKDPARQVEGFYTNEPNLMQTHWKWEPDAPYACAPWSDGLPAQFKKMHGYDLFSILSAIFEGNDLDSRRARIHYRQAVADLLTDSFSRQIREWCNARGIKSSGHFLLNQYLSMHAQGYGDMMKFVSEFDVPALDIPIPNPDEFMDFEYQQSRFFSSVASWKERDMTIMLLDPIIGGYGTTRLSPALPLLLNSVNMASFHGVSLFSSYLPLEPRNRTESYGRKSVAAGYTQEEYRFFNEYTGRLTQVLRGARREAGVALYYPIAMFQADLLASEKFWPYLKDIYQARQDAWDKTEKALLDGDIEYMIVHPEAVAEAEIADGKMNIGYGSYHTLVMPQMDLLPIAVVRQLKRFEQSGGKVLWIDEVPRGAEHVKNDPDVKKALQEAQITRVDHIAKSIASSFSQSFDLVFTPGTNTLTVGRFHKDGEQVYLLVNRTQKPLNVRVEGHSTDSIKVLDPTTGKISDAALPFRVSLEGVRGLLLMPGSKHILEKQ